MAGDRGRDLTFSILSDTDQLDLAKPAQGLDDLGRAAVDAGRDLDRLDASTSGLDVERLGLEAKNTARRVDDAFDSIAKSSRSSARTVDAQTDKMKLDLDDMGDEAADTAREMGASFDGSSDSVMDAVQEFGSLAAGSLGPIGVAAGAAAATGVGLIRAEQEKLKVLASEMVEEMIAAGGRLDDAAIQSKIEAMATEDPAAFVALQEKVESLGLAWSDYVRAKAGDGEASERIIQAMAEVNTKITEQASAAGSASGAMYAQQTLLNELSGDLGTTAQAYRIAQDAVNGVSQGLRDSEAPMADAQGNWDDLRGGMKNPITGKITLRRPGSGEYSAVRAAIQRGVGVIVVPVKPGTNVFKNTSSNSRYRD